MSKIKYPRGVWVLSSVEMWERFSFYTMQSLLVLYVVATFAQGGLGWSNARALELTGYYGAFVYVSPIVGGWIADRFIGRKVAVLLGSVIMMFGHASMAFHGETAMFIGMGLLVIGCGFMKPAISALVGEFFNKDEKSTKEAAFAIFYMSINIGGLLGPLFAGLVEEKYGFSYAFSMASAGLLLGIVNYLWFAKKDLKNVGNLPTVNPLMVPDKLSKNDWTKINVYLGLCVTNILWNIFYALPYGLLTLYADQNIDREVMGWKIPATWYFAMYGLFIVVYSPFMAKFYRALESKFDLTVSYKLAIGYVLVALGSLILLPLVGYIHHDPHYLGSSWYLIGFYSLFALSELITVPVLLSAATSFAPKGYSATLVSLNMAISWAIGAWLGGLFGSLTQTMDATNLFIGVIALCVIFAVLHVVTNKFIEKSLALE